MIERIWSILLEEARWPFKLLFVAAIGLLLFLIASCSTTRMTPDEREYVENERAAKWEACTRLYRAAHRPWISKHSHVYGKHRDWEIEEDLWMNNCHKLLCRAEMWECD